MPGASLRERRHELAAQRSLQGTDLCLAFSAAADERLQEVAGEAVADHGRAPVRGLALLAVGSYGRRELCPYSDLDLVLVHEGRADVTEVAERIWYPLWDDGVRIDHSVRRPKEVLTLAARDLRVALGVIDARLVWGDEAVGQPVIEAAGREWCTRLGAAWAPALCDLVERRRAQHGDLAFLLEPDVKESHGGLRDIHAIEAIAMFAPVVAASIDLEGVARARRVLLAVRVELHRIAGRALDRLVLQEQDQVAAALGYDDADALMGAVAEAGRTVAWAWTNANRRRAQWQPQPARSRAARRVASRSGTRPSSGSSVEPGIVLDDGEAALERDLSVASDPSLAFRLAAVAASHGVPIALGSLRRLDDGLHAVPEPWPDSVRDAFVRALSLGAPGVEAIEALDHEGVLVRLFPEWSLVRNKPQRNSYHRFTVDRHLLEAAAHAAGLTGRVERPDLLLLGALLHDVGKGLPGDHTDNGVELVARIGRRMGCAPADVDTLVTLCRLHLLLAKTATRRDLDDPATIELTARAVGDRQTLRLLWALTEADGLATGPAAWGPWKAGLVAELVERTERWLAGLPAPAGRDVTEDHRRLVGDVREHHHPIVRIDPPKVLVAGADRRGLLSSVAGVLALHGLDVVQADAASVDGIALDEFSVQVARGSWPETSRLRDDLESALSSGADLSGPLKAKARAYAGARRPSAATPPEPEVVVDTAASATATVLEVHAADELGLLHRVTRALFDCELDVVAARVSTVGDAVVDAFYVRDAAGDKITDPAVLDRIRRKLLAVLH